MKPLGQFFAGIATALGSSVLVLAAILLSLAEGSSMSAPPTRTVAVNATPAPFHTPDLLASPTATRLVIVLATQTEPSVPCAIPPGWLPYTVVAGDTLEDLAARTGRTAAEIRDANCLISAGMLPGTILYLPPVTTTATATPTSSLTPTLAATVTPWPTPTRCLPPFGWVLYRIQPGETLSSIGRAFGVSANQIITANCLTSSYIYAGDTLYVPNVPTRTPTATVTPVPSNTPVVEPSATFTETPPTPDPVTETPSETPTETPIETPVVTETTVETTQPTQSSTTTGSIILPVTGQFGGIVWVVSPLR